MSEPTIGELVERTIRELNKRTFAEVAADLDGAPTPAVKTEAAAEPMEWTAFMEWMEADFWGAPSKADGLIPLGIPYFIAKAKAKADESFTAEARAVDTNAPAK